MTVCAVCKTPPEGAVIPGDPLSNMKPLQQGHGLWLGSNDTNNCSAGVEMKQTLSMKAMDFERWVELAVNDPDEFEVMRQAAIEDFLASVSAERRLQLQRLQWRVDRVRERCTNPMAATIAISEMMWDAFYDLHDRYQDLFGSKAAKRYKQPAPHTSAKILPFEAPPVTT